MENASHRRLLYAEVYRQDVWYEYITEKALDEAPNDTQEELKDREAEQMPSNLGYNRSKEISSELMQPLSSSGTLGIKKEERVVPLQILPPIPSISIREAMPSTSQVVADPSAQGRKRKHNAEDNEWLKYARNEVNERTLKKQARNFVEQMHAHNLKGKGGRGYMWIKYPKLSEEWAKDGFDCLLPEIKGLNIYLRELSRDILNSPKRARVDIGREDGGSSENESGAPLPGAAPLPAVAVAVIAVSAVAAEAGEAVAGPESDDKTRVPPPRSFPNPGAPSLPLPTSFSSRVARAAPLSSAVPERRCAKEKAVASSVEDPDAMVASLWVESLWAESPPAGHGREGPMQTLGEAVAGLQSVARVVALVQASPNPAEAAALAAALADPGPDLLPRGPALAALVLAAAALENEGSRLWEAAGAGCCGVAPLV
jgi:hypothetical protein